MRVSPSFLNRHYAIGVVIRHPSHTFDTGAGVVVGRVFPHPVLSVQFNPI